MKKWNVITFDESMSFQSVVRRRLCKLSHKLNLQFDKFFVLKKSKLNMKGGGNGKQGIYPIKTSGQYAGSCNAKVDKAFYEPMLPI